MIKILSIINVVCVVDQIEHLGLDSWEGTLYIGTGCFHRREALQGRKYSKGYIEDWNRGVDRTCAESASVLEKKVEHLADCTYEHNTLWGKEVSLIYPLFYILISLHSILKD